MWKAITGFTPTKLSLQLRFSHSQPTIYALSTKPGRSAIGVVRVSGSESKYIFKQLSRSDKLPKPRVASVRKLYSPENGVMLDEALTLFFEGPKSYTGEDLLELHLHGGTAVIQSVIKAIQKLHGPKTLIRYAENGEFSRRAYQNGRFDLTEIEGIREIIDAETESQRVAALTSMTGGTSELFSYWRTEIVKNVALLTTVIDFGEDHDLEEVQGLFETVDSNISVLKKEILSYLNKIQRSEILLRGIKIILLGPPNAGKSSLLNFLANREAAIVSDIAGTTRDIIDVPLDIAGFKVVVGDTAGIRKTSYEDVIEAEGIKRAKLKSLQGDLVLVVLPVNGQVIDQVVLEHIEILKMEKEIMVVLNKSDLLNVDSEQAVQSFSDLLDIPAENIYCISCLRGDGVADMISDLTAKFRSITLTESTDPIIISQRAQDILRNDVLYGFEEFKSFKEQEEVVLATESLRHSIEGIGKITGDTVGIEEILGVVFSSFCIGK